MHLILATRVLADGSNVGAGLGLVVFLVLLASCILLFRSMSGRIKKLPASFEPPQPVPAPVDDEPQAP